jgi:hypothetical protein
MIAIVFLVAVLVAVISSAVAVLYGSDPEGRGGTQIAIAACVFTVAAIVALYCLATLAWRLVFG